MIAGRRWLRRGCGAGDGADAGAGKRANAGTTPAARNAAEQCACPGADGGAADGALPWIIGICAAGQAKQPSHPKRKRNSAHDDLLS
jgi:hypothetical protein